MQKPARLGRVAALTGVLALTLALGASTADAAPDLCLREQAHGHGPLRRREGEVQAEPSAG